MNNQNLKEQLVRLYAKAERFEKYFKDNFGCTVGCNEWDEFGAQACIDCTDSMKNYITINSEFFCQAKNCEVRE